MNKAVFLGGLTFATGVATGAVAYAARNDAMAVFALVAILSMLMGFITLAAGEMK